MNRILTTICAATITAAGLGFATAPANAVHLNGPRLQIDATANVLDAHYVNRNRDNTDRNRYERRGNNWYYNGYRGYRTPRRGYRSYNGFWFPAEAFVAAIINNQVRPSRRDTYRASNRHLRWCDNRYRSYRAYDNTFQPYHGPRRQCRSPYAR